MLPNTLIASLMLIAATVTDLHNRRVPHWIWIACLAAGLAVAIVNCIGAASLVFLWEFLWGALLGFAVGWLFYYVKAWGGGDSYLLFALGGILGATALLEYLLWMSIVGIVYATSCVIWKKWAQKKGIVTAEFEPKFPFVPAMSGAFMLNKMVVPQ